MNGMPYVIGAGLSPRMVEVAVGLIALLYFFYLAAVLNSTLNTIFKAEHGPQGPAFKTVFKAVFWAIVRRNVLLLFLLTPLIVAGGVLAGTAGLGSILGFFFWAVFIGATLGIVPTIIVATACGLGARASAHQAKIFGCVTLLCLFIWAVFL